MDDLVAAHEQILVLVPDDVVALERLEQLGRARGDRALVVRSLSTLADLKQGSAFAAEYLTRLAEELEAEGDARALEVYRKSLEIDPEQLSATYGLARLSQASGDSRGMAEAARYQAHLTGAPESSAHLLLRSAMLRAGELGEVASAIKDLEKAIELWPDQKDVAAELLVLLGDRGRHDDLVEILSRAARAARKKKRVVELWLDVATLQADDLGSASAGHCLAEARIRGSERPRSDAAHAGRASSSPRGMD